MSLETAPETSQPQHEMEPVEIVTVPEVVELTTEDGTFVETMTDGAAAQRSLEQRSIDDPSFEYKIMPFGVTFDEIDTATNKAKHWGKSSGFSVWKKKRSEVQ